MPETMQDGTPAAIHVRLHCYRCGGDLDGFESAREPDLVDEMLDEAKAAIRHHIKNDCYPIIVGGERNKDYV